MHLPDASLADPAPDGDLTTPFSAPESAPRAAPTGLRARLTAAWRSPWNPGLVAFAVAVVITIRTHFFYIFPYATPVSNDEGYLTALALRMFRGHWLPYVDGVSQRGPLLYWLTAIVMKIGQLTGHLWSWVPLRLFGVVLGCAVISLGFAFAAAISTPFAGGIAALVTTYFLVLELIPWDGVGVNGEPLAVAFALAAALVVTRLQLHATPRRTRAVVIAGVLSACAGLSKQMFLLHAVPVGLWILLGPVDRALPRAVRWREFGWFVAGALAPYAVIVAVYAASGHLGEFVYYYQRYGRDIFMDPLTRDYVRDKLREMQDRYFLGIATVGMLSAYAVGRAVRGTMATRVDPAQRGTFAERDVMSNVLLPGSGLAVQPGMRVVGVLVALVAPVAIALRVVLRRRVGGEYTVAASLRDAAIWFGVGLAAAALTAVVRFRRDPHTAFPLLDRLRRSAGDWFVVVQTAVALTGACFTFRFFPHYFVEYFPFLGVLAGVSIGKAFGDRTSGEQSPADRVGALTLVTGMALVMIAAHANLHRNVRQRRELDRWYQDPQADPVVKYVSEKTTPDQTIFVWGFRAETYLSSRRWPASRYVYTVYPAGVVPWFQATHDEEERRVVPGSRQQLLDDLERERPELVIDAGRSMSGRYMYNYPILRAYLDRAYCFMRYVDGEPVYRRKHGDRCPPADY